MSKRESNPRGEGEVLRARLVAAASDMLLAPQKIGLPALRAVARACGVSPAAVYLHFDSQQALIAAVIDAQLDDLTAHVRARVAASPAAPLETIGIAYAEWGLAHPGGYQLLFESADQIGTNDHDDESRWELVRALEVYLQDAGVTQTDARPAAYRLWATVHGIVSLRIHKPDTVWPADWRTDIHQLMLATTGRSQSIGATD